MSGATKQNLNIDRLILSELFYSFGNLNQCLGVRLGPKAASLFEGADEPLTGIFGNRCI